KHFSMNTTWLENHMLECSFKSTTGLDCPGCGMQRSIIELLQGDFKGSIAYYPGLLPLLITLLFLIAHLRFKFKHGASILKYLYITDVAIIIISYVIKLITQYQIIH
ncbi:MAG: DUF2752 domain-containing protein, partial [Bacteroidales bacterium]|nr:DUF2752 domain-containing protein [Bacteroidales bacterium]